MGKPRTSGRNSPSNTFIGGLGIGAPHNSILFKIKEELDMYSKTITYKDFDGEERTDKFYFNMTAAELMDIELEYDGNVSKALSNMTEKHDAKGILGIITSLIRHSYGEKSLDGKRFLKNQEMIDGFVTTEAYSALLLELLNDMDKLQEFMLAIIPSNARAGIENKESKVTELPAGNEVG